MEYHYYYCPTGKKHGCANPVMLKESDLVECVKDSLKGYIDNVSCLQAILDGIDQSSINQALANEYASHIAANEQQVEQALEFRARLYESLITGTISKEEYTDYKARYTRIAENAKESIRVLKEKLADVLENRSERNRWISHFTVLYDGDPGPQSCGSHDTEHQGDWEKGIGDHLYIPR